MKWFRRRSIPSPKERYEYLLATSTVALFNGAVLMANEIRAEWESKTGSHELSNEKTWTVQVELLWFLIAALCREISNIAGTLPQDRDAIQDGIVGTIINHMVERMFDRSTMTPDDRSKQVARFLDWCNEAEMDYGYLTKVAPTRDDISLEDNPSGKAAMRIARALGEESNIALMIDLSMAVMRTYIAINLPGITVGLVEALHGVRDHS